MAAKDMALGDVWCSQTSEKTSAHQGSRLKTLGSGVGEDVLAHWMHRKPKPLCKDVMVLTQGVGWG